MHGNALHHRPGHRAPQSSATEQARADRLAHAQRCRALPPMRNDEAQDLVAAFLASRGVTRCPPAYAVPVQGA